MKDHDEDEETFEHESDLHDPADDGPWRCPDCGEYHEAPACRG